jgi:hypothetical protein
MLPCVCTMCTACALRVHSMLHSLCTPLLLKAHNVHFCTQARFDSAYDKHGKAGMDEAGTGDDDGEGGGGEGDEGGESGEGSSALTLTLTLP